MPKPKLAAGLFLVLSLLFFASLSRAADDPGDELRRAASAGEVAKVKQLLDAGVDVNAANRYGGTALAFAADKGHTAVVDLLLERGANVNVQDTFYGSTPIAWAVRHGHAAIVRSLIAKGAKGGSPALILAAGEGHAEVMKVLLEVDKPGPEALSDALMVATQGEKPEVVALLQAAGAKPPVTVTLDPAVLKSYEGTFDGKGFSLTVAAQDGKLIFTTDGGPLTFAAVDPVTFRAEEVPGLKATFQVEEGKVRGITVLQGENPIPLTKRETP